MCMYQANLNYNSTCSVGLVRAEEGRVLEEEITEESTVEIGSSGSTSAVAEDEGVSVESKATDEVE